MMKNHDFDDSHGGHDDGDDDDGDDGDDDDDGGDDVGRPGSSASIQWHLLHPPASSPVSCTG